MTPSPTPPAGDPGEGSSYEEDFAIVPDGVGELGPYAVAVYWALARCTTTTKTCFPSHKWIADKAGVSYNTVRRCLATLRDAGWISWEQRRTSERELTTNIYTLYLARRDPNDLSRVRPHRPYPPPSQGVPPRPHRADPPPSQGEGTRTNEQEPIELKEQAHSPQKRDESAFDDFWASYPRKTGKQPARKAWTKATKQTKSALIIVAAVRYNEDPNRLDEYTKHPATWLNQQGWEDPPLPQRGGKQGTGEIFGGVMSLIANQTGGKELE